MPRIRNPFTPTFGMVPPFMAGRGKLLDEMSRAFEDGLGNPNLSTIIIGARVQGKQLSFHVLLKKHKIKAGFQLTP